MKAKITVLSLFDGMSCGQIALNKAKIKYNKYYASEIDKYAIKITQKNFSNTIQLGDITKWKTWNIEKPDLIIGGSPCQGFSFAGAQLNFNDERSKLFFVFVDILNHYKPKYFLLENVKMKKEYQSIISITLGVEPIEINSALVSAQNRKRLYWTNIPNIKQPKDRRILLKDILEDGLVDRPKSFCLDAGYYNTSGTNPDRYIRKSGRQIVYTPNKSQTILSTYYKENIKSMIKRNKKGLCVQVGDANIKGIESNKRVYSVNGKAPTLLGSTGGHKQPKISIGDLKFRKLTPVECERLQTVPDYYTEGVSNTQRYKMLGNGWTVDVIAHILKKIKARSCKENIRDDS